MHFLNLKLFFFLNLIYFIGRNYTCPICNVSLEKMEVFWRQLDTEIANTPMPEEYRDKKVGVLCRDCHKVNVAGLPLFTGLDITEIK